MIVDVLLTVFTILLVVAGMVILKVDAPRQQRYIVRARDAWEVYDTYRDQSVMCSFNKTAVEDCCDDCNSQHEYKIRSAT